MTPNQLPVLVVGGGIGGLAAELALTRRGMDVKVLEQAPRLGEIGAGIQLGPNAFAAFDALGIGEKARGRAVYTDEMVMHDALDETLVGRIPTGEAFRQRFGNPYAVIHRADVHRSLLEGAQESDRIEVLTSTTVQRVDQDDAGVTVHDARGGTHRGMALVGADGVKSAVRRQYVGDDARVSGHVVYRAVVDKNDFPVSLQWNAASIWVGPNCHLVHYPLRGGEQYNVVVTFHSRDKEEWSVKEGSREEVQSYFEGICAKARQLIDLPKDWKRWATADREPIAQWTFGRATLLGDAAHPTLQPGAGRLHGAGRRCHARRGVAHQRQCLRPGIRALPALTHRAYRAHRAVGARDGPHLPRHRRGAPGAQRTVERPHARALLRRDGVALWLEGRDLPGRLNTVRERDATASPITNACNSDNSKTAPCATVGSIGKSGMMNKANVRPSNAAPDPPSEPAKNL